MRHQASARDWAVKKCRRQRMPPLGMPRRVDDWLATAIPDNTPKATIGNSGRAIHVGNGWMTLALPVLMTMRGTLDTYRGLLRSRQSARCRMPMDSTAPWCFLSLPGVSSAKRVLHPRLRYGLPPAGGGMLSVGPPEAVASPALPQLDTSPIAVRCVVEYS